MKRSLNIERKELTLEQRSKGMKNAWENPVEGPIERLDHDRMRAIPHCQRLAYDYSQYRKPSFPRETGFRE